MTEPIKNCPFCDTEAHLHIEEDHHGEFFNLGCKDNSCIAYDIFYTREMCDLKKSIKAWNQRK